MVKVELTNNTYTVEPPYQWDTDQVLEVHGLSLQVVPEIHFAHEGMKWALTRKTTMDAAGVIRAEVPSALLQKPYRINAYICTTDGDVFQTLYKIQIPVQARTKPGDYVYVDEYETYSIDSIEVEALGLANDAEPTVEKVVAPDGRVFLRFGLPVPPSAEEVQVGVIEATLAAAENSASAAASSASAAKTSETNAKESAAEAKFSANVAADNVSTAQAASRMAVAASEAAGESETNAKKSENAAAEYAEQAKNAASGSGGGAGSWKDLGEGTGLVELLGTTVLMSNPTQIPEELPLVVGNVYTVNWNGVDYEANALDGSAMLGVAGSVILGMNTNRFPFTIYVKPGEGTTIMIDSGSAPAAVSVGIVGDVIIPVPTEYLPEALQIGEEQVVVELLAESEAEAYTNASFGEMWMVGKAPELETGKIYTINYNGASYDCACLPAPAGFTSDENAVAMGNFYVAGGENTGEPFAMLISFVYQRIDIIDLSGASSVTVSILGEGNIVHPLDGKYLPEGTPWIEKIGNAEIVPEITVAVEDDGFIIDSALPLIVGEIYTVKWNGVEYSCRAQDATSFAGEGAVALGNCSEIGLDGDGEPFLALSIPKMGKNGQTQTVVYDGSTEVVLSVIQQNVIAHKLDNRCLDPEYIKQNVEKTFGKDLKNKANKSAGVFYIEGNSDAAGQWYGEHDDIEAYYPGLMIAYKPDVAGHSDGTTLDINGIGAVPVVRNATTEVTTTYAAKSVIFLTYTEDAGTPYWKIADYDSNTKTYSGTSNKADTKMYLVGATKQTSSGTTTYTNKSCYIGTDNRLYSNGAAVIAEGDTLTLTSPNGTKFALAVSDDGTLTATEVTA